MQSFVEQLSLYNSYHKNPGNKILHFVGVPFVVFALLILLGWFHLRVPHFFDVTLAWIISVGFIIYYFFLDYIIAGATAIALIILNIISSLVGGGSPTLAGLYILLIFFFIGAVCLFVGHLMEHKKPAFATDLCQLVIAPMYVVAELLFAFGIKEDLQAKIKLPGDGNNN